MIARDTGPAQDNVSSPVTSPKPPPSFPRAPCQTKACADSTSTGPSRARSPSSSLTPTRPPPPASHPPALALNPLSRMASIHALPVELLSRIFTLGTFDPIQDFASPSAPIPRDPPFEVLISHVCAHWRDVALRTPHLWTSVAVTQVSHVLRARAYVVRSARLAFDILFDTSSESEYVRGHSVFRDEFLPAFEPLTPHIARWRSMILRVRDLECKRHARTVLSTVGPAPQLRALELWHIEEWANVERLWGHVGPPPVVVFDGMLPALTRLSLIGVNIQWSEVSSPFLRNLTELELGVHSDDVRIPFDRWLAVLDRSPTLERLWLHYSGPRVAAVPWLLPAGPVRLPRLRDLKLADLDVSYACALVRTFVAPAVRKLHLELGWMDSRQDYSAFVDLLVRAPDPDACPALLDPTALAPPADDARAMGAMFPALEELSIASIATCTLAGWHALLRAAPRVHTLAVDFAQMERGAFDVLAGTLAPPLPRVTHYGDAGYMYAVDPHALAAQAAGREWHAGCGVADDPPDPELLPALRTLRVSGVSGAALGAYCAARKRVGRPIGRLLVREKDRDRELERMRAQADAEVRAWEARKERDGQPAEEEPCRIEWFRDEDDEEEAGELEATDVEDGVGDVPGSGSDDASSEDHEHDGFDALAPAVAS